MNTAVVITKTEPEVKKKAQQLAKELGVSLSSLLNAYLRQLIRTRKVEFDLGEEPSDYLIKDIKQAQRDRKAGRASPIFETGEEAAAWLKKQGV